jgi:methylmalonyl-CoA epimerase
MFKTIDHLGVAVSKIEPALETLKKAGPVVLGKEELIPAFGVRAIMVATGDGIPIEFIEPTSEESNVAKFIAQRGGGLHHVAYRVENIEASLADLQSQGFNLIDKKPRHGYADSLVAFVHPKSFFGVLTELVQRREGHDVAPYETE